MKRVAVGFTSALALAMIVIGFLSIPSPAQNPVFGATQTPVQFNLANRGGLPGQVPPPPGPPYVVNSAQRLVIEFISGHCTIGFMPFTPEGGSILLSTQSNGNRLSHYLYAPFVHGDGAGGRYYGFSQRTRIYADPGSAVSFTTIPSGAANFVCYLTVSGYTVPADARGAL